MAQTLVVGGGVGGLVAAIRLAVAGHSVAVLERNPTLGGKLASKSIEGFHFDIGPSLLTLPHVFDEVFHLAGGSLSTAVPLNRLEMPFRHHFADGSVFEAWDDRSLTENSLKSMGADTSQWRRFLDAGKQIWDISERSFFAGPMEGFFSLLRRMRSPGELWTISGHQTLNTRAQNAFTDDRMRMWANRYATYSGSSPYRAPATLSCIPYVEQQYGCWHIRGGLSRLADALKDAAESLGVRISTDTTVTSVETDGQRVTGVRVEQTPVPADIVVANVDAEVLYRRLLPWPKALSRVVRAGRSSSAFALLLNVAGKTLNLAHHNVWYSPDPASEFQQIFDLRQVPSEPTIYACCSAVTDASMAPEGDENWFVLVNVPESAETDWASYRDSILQRLPLAGRIRNCEMITPRDLESRYCAPGGAIYGTSSNGLRSAFLRAANRGPVRGLYLTGGSAHPGGGLPLVALSASIVAGMIDKDFS